jgi:hypothetical protein
MGRSVARAILEGIRRKQEDSEMQMYATEPPGAMGEGRGDWFVVSGGFSSKDYIEAHNYGQDKERAEASMTAPPEVLAQVKPKVIQASSESEAIQKYKQMSLQTRTNELEEMEFTIDESGPLDENEWMSLDEMELECVECAGKMSERKMTRILRREAEACVAKHGKKERGPTPDDEG